MTKSIRKRENIKIVLASRLRRRRRELDITQADLAKKAKVSQSTIAQIESSTKEPSLSTLIRLSEALKISVAELLLEGDRYSKSDSYSHFIGN